MFFIYCYNNHSFLSIIQINLNEWKQLMKEIYFWMIGGIHFNLWMMGYSFRYVFFHQSFKFFLINSIAFPLISEVNEMNGEGEINWEMHLN